MKCESLSNDTKTVKKKKFFLNLFTAGNNQNGYNPGRSDIFNMKGGERKS